MTEDEKYQWLEKVSEKIFNFNDELRGLVKDLSSDQQQAIVELLRLQANEDEAPIFNYAASRIEFEILFKVFERASQYMEKTGETFYCLYCDGACTPEHIKDFEEDDSELPEH